MSVASLLTQRCTIQRATITNSGGEVSSTYATITNGTDVPCLVQEKSGRLRSTGAGQVAEYNAVIFFGAGVDVRPAAENSDLPDKIILTTPANSRTYMVVYVSDETGRNAMKTCYASAQ